MLPLCFAAVFVLGLLAGGFVNFCARRLPYERALLWPGPRCFSCCQRMRWYDCLPVVGYVLTGGRCRTCAVSTALRDPLVELFTGVLFVGLFAVVAGLVDVPLLGRPRWTHHPDVSPARTLVFFAHFAVLTCLLLIASLCDLSDMEIPFSLTTWGTAIGLASATLFPWPYPLAPGDPAAVASPYPALYAWPVWHWNQLPSWLPLGSPQLGLLTGLAGAAAGTAVLRAVGYLFKLGRGIEGMGVGDADLMMMAGAFVGWQAVVIAFFVAVLPGLAFAIAHLVIRRSQALPFGPSLAVGVILTVLWWPALGGYLQPLFFEKVFLLLVFGGGAALLFVMAFLLWAFRWLMGADEGAAPPTPPTVPPPPIETPPQPKSEGMTCDPS